MCATFLCPVFSHHLAFDTPTCLFLPAGNPKRDQNRPSLWKQSRRRPQAKLQERRTVSRKPAELLRSFTDHVPNSCRPLLTDLLTRVEGSRVIARRFLSEYSPIFCRLIPEETPTSRRPTPSAACPFHIHCFTPIASRALVSLSTHFRYLAVADRRLLLSLFFACAGFLKARLV